MHQIIWITPTADFLQDIDPQKIYLVEEILDNRGNSESRSMKILRELSVDEYTSLRDSSKMLYEFEYLQRKQKEVFYNLDDFYKIYQGYCSDLSKTKSPIKISSEEMTEIYVNVNRTFINYINSARILIEHLESTIIHKYTKISSEFKTFKNHTSYLFDSFFSYRFIYALRNYAEHINYPIYRINRNAVWNGSNHSISLSLFFDKEMLLKSESTFRACWGIEKG